MSSLNTSTPQHLNTFYPFFSARRRLLAGLTALLWAASLLALAGMNIDEDIRSMLPDEPPEVVRHFRLLQESPLSNKLLVQVSAGEGVSTGSLLEAADRLAHTMGLPWFSRVMNGPPVTRGEGLQAFLMDALPSLFTEEDRERVTRFLAPDRVKARLEQVFHDLHSPAGWGGREFVRQDPLGLRILTLEKLRHVSPIPEMNVVDGRFVSRDGRHVLLIAETPVAMTDAQGGKALIAGFRRLAEDTLPPGVKAFLYGGHLYTVANAESVRKDLRVVLSVSSGILLLLFLLFIRSWSGLVILLVPASTLLTAAAGTALVASPVSAVTLGFGAVLMGISIDFGVHVYFALRGATTNEAEEVTGRVAVPVLFGGLTTMAAFGVLLFSSIPGQRQLGLFSLFGMAGALLLSLVVLPHWIRPLKRKEPVAPDRRTGTRSPWVVWTWIAFLCLGGWQATRLEFDGDLRSLNQAPAGVQEMEDQLTRTWGKLLGRAVLVAEGHDMASAAEVNDRLFSRLRKVVPGGDIMSLAPLLPSSKTQEENRRRWRAFWSDDRVEAIRETMAVAGGDLGFSRAAFDPFFERLRGKASELGTDDLARAGLDEILGGFVLHSEDGVRILSLVSDSPALMSELSGVLGDPPEVHVISPAAFGDMISRALARDFMWFILGAGGAVLLLLGLLLRSPGRVGSALVPVVTGLAAVTGGMALLGIPMNAFHTVAAVLILGLGVDYGVFMVMRVMRGPGLCTEKAVLVSGLTTLAGFGALALAGHPALHAMGVTVLLGIGAAVPAALLVIPALVRGPRE